jgi:hypothetical protein
MTTARILGNNGLLLNSSQEYKEQVANELFRLVSVGRAPILSRTLTTPPTSGLTADSFYIVPAGASGAWAGKTNQIAFPSIGVNGQPVSGAWKFYKPFAGLNVSLVSGGTFFYDGDSWATVLGGGDMLAAEYDSDGDMKVDAAEVADSIVGSPVDDTFYGKESGNKGFFNFFPKVRSTVLTGLSTATGGAISATDTILQALGKIQKQITELAVLIDSISGQIEVASNKTYILERSVKRAYLINNITINSASGSVTGSVQINGNSVSGLSNFTVNTTLNTYTATSQNNASENNSVTLLLSNNSSALDVSFTMEIEYA